MDKYNLSKLMASIGVIGLIWYDSIAIAAMCGLFIGSALRMAFLAGQESEE